MTADMNALKSITEPFRSIDRPGTPGAPPVTNEMSGWMTFVTRAFTTAVNAPPMMTPTAMSITLPLLMNSANSAMTPFLPSLAMRASMRSGPCDPLIMCCCPALGKRLCRSLIVVF